MAYRDLNAYVELLRQRGWLKEVDTPVEVDLEISHLADRAIKTGGPALLFRRPCCVAEGREYDFPVLINSFGTKERMLAALEVESFDDLAREINELLEPEIPTSLIGKLKSLPKLQRLGDLAPRLVSHAPCQELVETANPTLADIPIIKCWPQDGGRYITLPLVITKHPTRGTRNIGMYRLQKFDDQTLGMHWQRHKGGAHHHRVGEEAGRRIEVAIALGPDPACIYAATCPLPDEMDEFMIAGFIRHQPVELVKCKTVDLEVPSNSQIVLEGFVEPGEYRQEGPFGDHQGYYSRAEDFPVFHLTAVTRRRQPIYPTILVGPPPCEDQWLGEATIRMFLPVIQKTLPELVDMNLPVEGIFHNLAIVSIDKRYPGHAKKVMHAIWGLGQLAFTKIVIVVDKDVNVHDLSEVLWKVGCNIDPKHDCLLTEGIADVLDFAARQPAQSGKLGIDATRKWAEEGYPWVWPEECRMPAELIERLAPLLSKLGLA